MIAWRKLSGLERAAALGAAAGLVCLFAVARWLTPDSRGLGTHEQLGLSPCLSAYLFRFPCPFCGMTTAFAYMARGQVAAAFAAQPAGALAFLGCALALPVSFAAAASGRFPQLRFHGRLMWGLITVGAVALLASWAYKIAAYLL